LLVDGPGWHWIFWLPAIGGVAVLVAVLLLLRESPTRTGGAVDHLGTLLLCASLAALVVAISRGATWGCWTAPLTLGVACGSVVALALFAACELRSPDPLVDLRMASRPRLVAAHAASLLLGFAAFANMMVTPQLLQQPTSTGYGLGLSTATAGLWLVPMATSFGFFAPLAPLVIRRLGPSPTVCVGAGLMTVSYAARVFLSDGLAEIVAGSVAVSLGTLLTYAALPIMVMREAPGDLTAAATASTISCAQLAASRPAQRRRRSSAGW